MREPTAPALGTVPALAAHGLHVRAGNRLLVADLQLQLAPGELLAVLGCNGSGKTLTLHTLAGLRPPDAGRVELEGRPIRAMGRRALARRLGVLTQDSEEGLTTRVLDCVLIGRHPHLHLLQWESAADRQLAHECLERVGLAELAERTLATLSGGEQRRVAIAALLAQQPHVYLLDEPTNHLDPQHQLRALELFRQLTRTGRSVVASLHDPSLAARFADRALLLLGDGRWIEGPAEEILTAEHLQELYHTPMLQLSAAGRRLFASA